MFDPEKLGAHISRSRKIKGITQEELAKLTGTSRQTIMRVENGGCNSVAFKTVFSILEEVGWNISFHKGVIYEMPETSSRYDEAIENHNSKYSVSPWWES